MTLPTGRQVRWGRGLIPLLVLKDLSPPRYGSLVSIETARLQSCLWHRDCTHEGWVRNLTSRGTGEERKGAWGPEHPPAAEPPRDPAGSPCG